MRPTPTYRGVAPQQDLSRFHSAAAPAAARLSRLAAVDAATAVPPPCCGTRAWQVTGFLVSSLALLLNLVFRLLDCSAIQLYLRCLLSHLSASSCFHRSYCCLPASSEYLSLTV